MSIQPFHKQQKACAKLGAKQKAFHVLFI
jgi:hypothetical protein